jgi:fructose-1,6-bisphosphatase
MIRKMLSDFGLNPDEGRIINGHTPVKEIVCIEFLVRYQLHTKGII